MDALVRRSTLRAVHSHLAFCAAVAGAATFASACSGASSDGSVEQTTSANSANGAGTAGTIVSCQVPAGCIRADRVKVVDTLTYGQASNPFAYAGTPRYVAFRFDGVAGDVVDIVVHSPDGDARAWLLDSEYGILAYNNDDPAGGTLDSHITKTLPASGSLKHFVAVNNRLTGPATFVVTLNGTGIEPISYPATRILQSDIDTGRYTADQLFAFSDFMFSHTFTVAEGLGNALTPPLAGPNPPPNTRQIHNGKFGGPDSTSCDSCHFVGGNDGAGDLAHNLFQDGDGVNMSSVLVRQPPALLGVGYIQQLGLEMTADLQGQLAAAQTAAAAGTAQTVNLVTKGVGFGTIVVNTDGTLDTSQLQGVDKDLVVKPLGWKGRTPNTRRFVEGGFQVHLGMASQNLVASNCKKPIPNVVGDGPDCTDPDNDGVRDEILESQLTEMALYPTLLQVPIRINPTDPTALSRVQNGESLFNQVGCTSCHVQSLVLQSSLHLEKPDLSGGPGFQVDLTVDGRLPRLGPQPDGTVNVELWSDLKRHDMGESLADPHDTFGGAVPARLFMTRPLWGVGITAPYLHDGRAPDLSTAISLHDGEAASVRDAFLALDPDSQAQLVEFLQTLSRDPRHNDD